ncbi:MAG: family 78 glycoside hydrolase catalytic domain [Clostridia bacterium]|nr:family 78 glycoside hydrolase catalytic domain [Clostridia bacterium]
MSLKIYDLTVNYLKNPCGIDSLPRFSYKVSSDSFGDKQTKRRIRVYSASEILAEVDPDVWDSGWVEDEENVLIPYEGGALSPVTRYYWSVEIETASGERAGCYGATFVTGKLGERFTAKWIAARGANKRTVGANYLRKTFDIYKDVKRAYLTICGLGYFESYINGEKTGDDLLSPAFTSYDKETLYMQYDVEHLLRKGENVIGVALGNGFYNHFTEDNWNYDSATWRNFPKLICELKITYKDGKTETIVSDTSWTSFAHGPIKMTGIRNGEFYDARLELGKWTEPGYDDDGWDETKLGKCPGGIMRAQEMEPIRVYKKFPAIRKWQSKEGWVYDIGQNIAGYGEFVIKGRAGDKVTFRYSDVLAEDGVELDFKALGCFVHSGDFQTDRYTKKSYKPEKWHPTFVYHGFQYIEVLGIEDKDNVPELDEVVGVAICNDVGDIGSFSCSDEMLNKLQHLCRWSSLSNFESIPTDNPHREKNGWTGDTSLSCEQMLTNFGTRCFLSKWSRDLVVSQRPAGQIPCIVPSPGWGYSGLMGPDWSSALITVPWYIYLYNNDKEILRQSYEAIKKNIDFTLSMCEDYVPNYGTGDWCAPFDGPAIGVNMGSYKCPVEVTDTGYLYNAANTVVKLAHIFGEKEDEKYYKNLALTIRQVFRSKFFDKETFTVMGDCQTATGTMLFFELYDTEEEKQGLLAKLKEQIAEKDDHLDFGVLGCKFVMNALGSSGNGDIGTKMVLQRTYPGVAEWINRGATTLWECWNGGGSHNHHMFSSLSSFMYKYIAGIAPDEAEPGFRHVIFRPAIDSELTSARASHESMLGTVLCDWSKDGESICVNVEVPFGAHGTLYLPERFAGKAKCGGKVLEAKVENGKAVYEFVSGKYTVEA